MECSADARPRWSLEPWPVQRDGEVPRGPAQTAKPAVAGVCRRRPDLDLRFERFRRGARSCSTFDPRKVSARIF